MPAYATVPNRYIGFASELYLLFVEERRWSPAEVEAWLADAWCRLLLEPS